MSILVHSYRLERRNPLENSLVGDSFFYRLSLCCWWFSHCVSSRIWRSSQWLAHLRCCSMQRLWFEWWVKLSKGGAVGSAVWQQLYLLSWWRNLTWSICKWDSGCFFFLDSGGITVVMGWEVEYTCGMVAAWRFPDLVRNFLWFLICKILPLFFSTILELIDLLFALKLLVPISLQFTYRMYGSVMPDSVVLCYRLHPRLIGVARRCCCVRRHQFLLGHVRLETLWYFIYSFRLSSFLIWLRFDLPENWLGWKSICVALFEYVN